MTSDELRDMAERLIEMADEMDGIVDFPLPSCFARVTPEAIMANMARFDDVYTKAVNSGGAPQLGTQRNYDCSESLPGEADLMRGCSHTSIMADFGISNPQAGAAIYTGGYSLPTK